MSRLRTTLCAFILLAALTSAAAAQEAALTLLGYHATPPASWQTKPPTSSMRLAQFTVPAADAANAAEVVVYFFGAGQGGGVEANLGRWREQFTADGAPVNEKVTRDSSGAFPTTIAEYHGTYRRGIGMGSADSAKTGQALIAAIVETPRGTLFIQMFGPEAGAVAERGAFTAFVRSIK